MGGRGSSGGSGGSGGGNLSTPKMQDLKGSAKQVAWAEDIRESAFQNLRNMENNRERMIKLDSTFEKDIPYTKSDLVETKKYIAAALAQPAASKASTIIDMRRELSYDNIKKTAETVHKEGLVWDSSKNNFVKKKKK